MTDSLTGSDSQSLGGQSDRALDAQVLVFGAVAQIGAHCAPEN